MVLKYKNTIYDVEFEVTNSHEGIKQNNFWINIKLRLKNNEIDYDGVIPGMNFEELQYWNKKNEEFLNGTMTDNEEVHFIRRLGELLYFPKEEKVEKRLFLFDNVEQYYSIIIEKDEIAQIYENNKIFIKNVAYNIKSDKAGILD